jgi:hypothetical protein
MQEAGYHYNQSGRREKDSKFLPTLETETHYPTVHAVAYQLY